MLIRLTLASNSCNRGNPAGDQSMPEKAQRVAVTGVQIGPTAQCYGLKARCDGESGLPEPQTGALTRRRHTGGLRVWGWRRAKYGNYLRGNAATKGCLVPTTPPTHHRWVTGRTRQLTAPHLLHCVNTGSPKRAALNGPAWRWSRHSSRMLWVTPVTAAATRTAVAETDRATGRGTPAKPGEGRRIQGTVAHMAANGIADVNPCRGDGADPRGRRSRMRPKEAESGSVGGVQVVPRGSLGPYPTELR